MTGKITRGRSFRGLVRYVVDERPGLSPDEQPRIIGGNMAGKTSRELTREFQAVRQLRPDVHQPVEHISLSFPPGERVLSNRELAEIAADYLRRRGYDPDRCQFLVVRHSEKTHQHCHIILNRVRIDSSLVPQQFREYLRNKEVCREIERAHRLTPVTSRRPDPTSPRRGHEWAPSRGEQRMWRERGVLSTKERLKGVIRAAAKDRPTMTVFLQRLERKRVQVIPNMAATGRVSGISFRLDHVAVKGSRLGRGFSWEGLQRELGVSYSATRDLQALTRAARAARGHELPLRRGMNRRALETLLRPFPEIRTSLGIAARAAGALRRPEQAVLRLVEPPLLKKVRIATKVVEIIRPEY